MPRNHDKRYVAEIFRHDLKVRGTHNSCTILLRRKMRLRRYQSMRLVGAALFNWDGTQAARCQQQALRSTAKV